MTFRARLARSCRTLASNPLLIGVLTLLLVVVIRTAWVSDDAYITFRVIDNFDHGYGLRWNIDERIQVYTHPLWMLILAALSLVTSHQYFTTIGVSILLTMAAAFVLATEVAIDLTCGIIAVVALTMSRAFVDYSTSGLENPLTNLLLVVFFALYFTPAVDRRRAVWLGFVAGLAVLNRLDSAFLVLPALMLTCWRERGHLRAVAVAAAAPLVLWEVFALVYYGFPLPNTVYAKLQTGIPTVQLVGQGLLYLLNSIDVDPITLTTVAAVTAFSVTTRVRSDWPVLLGIAAYLVFIVRAGGDFMTGRMLSAPFLCAVVLMSRFEPLATSGRSLLTCSTIVLLGLGASHPTVLSQATDTAVPIERNGIADERLFYYSATGLLRAPLHGSWPGPFNADLAARARTTGRRSVRWQQIGLDGFHAGPGVHLIDPMGLGDALIARLPARSDWRVGHYLRDLPAGYEETVETGVNVIQDPALSAFYERLRLITQGPIWDRRRARAIVRMNLGIYDGLIR